MAVLLNPDAFPRFRHATSCYGAADCDAVCGGQQGWRIPYLQSLPMTTLLVSDLTEGATFSGFLPFLLDTGASTTVIPRRLLPPFAFRRVCDAFERVRVVDGRLIPGLRFPALLSLAPDRKDCPALTFDPLDVFIPDDLSSASNPYALLGMDALRQVETTFRRDGAHLHRPVQGIFQP
jgi:hypothetical protein